MKLEINIENRSASDRLPAEDQFRRWVMAALRNRSEDAELGLCLVDEDESRDLNRRYRGKDKPTNVLSFDAGLPDGLEHPLLGDLVICAPLLQREAQEQNKDCTAHWAHLVIHGVLHLLGHDHRSEAEALEMERLETRILDGLGYDDPYQPD